MRFRDVEVKNVTIRKIALINMDKCRPRLLLPHLGDVWNAIITHTFTMFKITDPKTFGENPRKMPGVVSFVSCNQQGRILYLKGTDKTNLVKLTNEIIGRGVKIGEAASFVGFEGMTVAIENAEAIFIQGKDQNSGLIYNANHGQEL